MGVYVAGEAIKLLIKQGYNVKGGIVTVLGLTFKENVPDLRNTRVIDVIRELREYGVQVQVHDPVANPAEARHEYGIDLIPFERLAKASAVVLAVPHASYLAGGWDLIAGLLGGGQGVVVDVKAKLPKDRIPASIHLWRL
jgi:UDP-N-acetyl-D-galactosamine dehydrogenase